MAGVTEIAALEDVKNYLRFPNPSETSPDDVVLQVLMDAATQAIEREVGHIVAKNITAERHNGGCQSIFVRQVPVLYVQNVEEGWGYYNWDLASQTVNTQPPPSIWAYSLDKPDQGLITRRGPGNVIYPFVIGTNNIRIDYVVGRETVPPAAVLAFLELVAFWYRNSQLREANNPSGTFNAMNADETRTTGMAAINLGVPSQIIEMLNAAGRRRPFIS